MNTIGRPLLLAVFSALILLQGCATVPYTGRAQTNMMSVEAETRAGNQAAQAYLRSLRTCRDREMNEKVKRIGKQIVDRADAPQYKWRFHCVEDQSFNAVAFPGGTIAINSGVVKTCDNDDQLASVVGHEAGHVIARHGAERMTKAMITQTVVSILGVGVAAAAGGGKGMASDTATLLGLLAQYGILLPYSRENEYEADMLGMILMTKAGYDPGQAAALWQKLVDKNPNPKKGDFLSTHPADVKRLEAMRANLPKALAYRPGGARFGDTIEVADAGGNLDRAGEGVAAAAPEDQPQGQAGTAAPPVPQPEQTGTVAVAAVPAGQAQGQALVPGDQGAPDGSGPVSRKRDRNAFHRGLMP